MQGREKLISDNFKNVHGYFLDSLNESILVCDTEGIILYVNQKTCDLLELSQEELLGKHFAKIYSAEEPPSPYFIDKINEVSIKKNVVFEAQAVTKNEKEIFVEISAELMNGSREGEAGPLIVITGRDITRHKKNLENLHFLVEELESERSNLQAFLDSSHTAIIMIDSNATIVRINKIVLELTLKPQDDIVGKKIGDGICCIHAIKFPLGCGYVEECSECIIRKTFEHVLKTKESVNKVEYRQVFDMDNHRHEHFFEISASYMLVEEKSYVIFALEDVTERKRLQKEKDVMQLQLFRSAKLASVGLLAAGIAHEINNPLAIMQGNVDLLRQSISKKQTQDHSEELEFLESQSNAINRCAKIVNALRAYTRMDVDLFEDVDIHGCIEDTLFLIENIYKKENIQIELDLKGENHHVMANSGKFQQVLVNLLINAKDALKGIQGPKIFVRTHNDFDSICIEIMDNGMGIEKDAIEKVFDPFFTTKDVGNGTGLGLSISQGIVESFGGKIRVESESGVGTCFIIKLPFIQNPSKEKDKKHKKQISHNMVEDIVVKMSGRVLVVEEEAGLGNVLKKQLELLGLEVVSAFDGFMALEILKSAHFDYVIIDIKMPKITGDRFLVEAYKLNPRGTRFIVITGQMLSEYSDVETVVVEKLAHGHLRKPFELKDLINIMKKFTGRGVL